MRRNHVASTLIRRHLRPVAAGHILKIDVCTQAPVDSQRVHMPEASFSHR